MNKIKQLGFYQITKEFPGVKALNNITFDVHTGSIHALMGENGAGKSTLLKILSGLYQPTSGELRLNNIPIYNTDTSAALRHRIAIIYQELNLIPELTVAENIYIGQLPTIYGHLDKKKLNINARKQLEKLNEDIDPNTPLKELSIGQCQMVEIAKALSRDARIIAFDEPTSSLSKREIQNLFKVIRELRDEGRIIIYVSHRMEEIFELCDAITIFKDGTHVKTELDIHKLTNKKLVSLMVGRNIGDIYNYRARSFQGKGLSVKDISSKDIQQPISFSVQKGEILGFFGLVGAGRSELCRLIFGADSKDQGEIYFEGKKISINSPKQAIRYGVTYCPEDRKSDGIIPILSVKENTNISARPWHLIFSSLIKENWEIENVNQQVNALRIKTPNISQLIGNLSGGNQQKVILARWLSLNTRVIILDEPTRGIDVGAKTEIYNFIFKLAEQGVCVIVVSSDLPEVLGISDRILVMKDGSLTGQLLRPEFNEEQALSFAMLNKKTA